MVGKSDPALLIFAIGPVAVNQVKDTEQRGEDKRHNVVQHCSANFVAVAPLSKSGSQSCDGRFCTLLCANSRLTRMSKGWLIPVEIRVTVIATLTQVLNAVHMQTPAAIHPSRPCNRVLINHKSIIIIH